MQTQNRIQTRASRLRAIEKIIIESEWTRKCKKHFNIANKPSYFKPYKGRPVKHDSDDESSGGEEVLSEVSDFQILQMMMINY